MVIEAKEPKESVIETLFNDIDIAVKQYNAGFGNQMELYELLVRVMEQGPRINDAFDSRNLLYTMTDHLTQIGIPTPYMEHIIRMKEKVDLMFEVNKILDKSVTRVMKAGVLLEGWKAELEAERKILEVFEPVDHIDIPLRKVKELLEVLSE